MNCFGTDNLIEGRKFTLDTEDGCYNKNNAYGMPKGLPSSVLSPYVVLANFFLCFEFGIVVIPCFIDEEIGRGERG